MTTQEYLENMHKEFDEKWESLLKEVDDYDLFGKPASHTELDDKKVLAFFDAKLKAFVEMKEKEIRKELRSEVAWLEHAKDYRDKTGFKFHKGRIEILEKAIEELKK